jgi:hypothetical protein
MTRLISLLVIRGAWWVSAILVLLDIAFEGGYRAKKRKAASTEKTGAAV